MRRLRKDLGNAGSLGVALPRPAWQEGDLEEAHIEILRRPDGALHEVGSGAYGEVYKGLLDGVQTVAVKRLTDQSPHQQERFSHEISLLRSCRAENIVSFLGATFGSDGTISLVMEYVPFGNLFRNIHHPSASEKDVLQWYNRGRKVAIDVARGLVYLHGRKILHCDIKSGNILLGRGGVAKIADVGLAKLLSSAQTMASAAGTFDWAAPEILAGEPCNEKADIYSFGIVLWELVTLQAPRLRQTREVECPKECPKLVAQLILRCKAVDPRQRPSAREVYDILQATSDGRRRSERDAPAPVSRRSVSMPDDMTRQAARVLDAGGAAALVIDEGLPLASPHAGSSGGGGGGGAKSGSSSDGCLELRERVIGNALYAWAEAVAMSAGVEVGFTREEMGPPTGDLFRRLREKFAIEVKKRLIARPNDRDSNIAVEHMVSSFRQVMSLVGQYSPSLFQEVFALLHEVVPGYTVDDWSTVTEEPTAEQKQLILRNWAALQRSRISVEKGKFLMMESLSNSATDRNLDSYNRRTMLASQAADNIKAALQEEATCTWHFVMGWLAVFNTRQRVLAARIQLGRALMRNCLPAVKSPDEGTADAAADPELASVFAARDAPSGGPERAHAGPGACG
ncbi:hypothetical protein WJX81_000902 [Elliptochloris bilobata]|uniref:Protein kinase domain-containing protein n=1 Tax=Elliptochloris bilobata TaxID=381761 RepID=A0AAW1SHV6_9CHLO